MDDVPQSRSIGGEILRWGGLVAVIAIVIGIIWGLVYLVGMAWDAFTALDRVVAATIVAGVFTLLALTSLFKLARNFAAKRKQRELLCEQKIETYDEFSMRVFDVLTLVADGEKNELEGQMELARLLREYQRQFLLWSNDRVIRALVEWRDALTDKPDSLSVMKMEALFLAMRRDLAHSDWKIGYDIAELLTVARDPFLSRAKFTPRKRR